MTYDPQKRPVTTISGRAHEFRERSNSIQSKGSIDSPGPGSKKSIPKFTNVLV